MKKILMLVLMASSISACNTPWTESTTFDQSSLCSWSDEASLKNCKEGQLGFFAPATFGNEQLPLLVTANYCDFRHPVVYNSGGVVCVITFQRIPKGSDK